MVVIFKKGDHKLPSNYRPIAILSILYKLFSRMLCARLQHTIVGQQSVDQAAYRKGFSTEDHLLSTTLLLESCAEFNVDVWLGLVDFEKAFDTVEHDTLWDALDELGVAQPYTNLLKKLYSCQQATVVSGVESRPFDLQRGVKQGDPLSSFLFIAVMEVVFRHLKCRWGRLNQRRSGQYYGMVIDDPTNPLSNLRFADDVLLVACSKTDICKMIADLSREAGRYGLKMHMGKTKVLTTSVVNRPLHIKCLDQSIQVVPEGETEKYLGRKLATDEYHDTELSNRMVSGWACFFKLKASLCSRKLSFKYRIQLFDACVVPCALYACGTWTMTKEREQVLTRTRRRMLRWMVCTPRPSDESWVDYIIRWTHRAEDLAEQHGSTDWVTTQRRRKLTLAGRAALCDDARWMKRLLNWKPWFRCWPHRAVGRPVRRWMDDIDAA